MAIIGTTGLYGCSSYRVQHQTTKTPPTKQEERPTRRLDYAIEQNGVGEFVFCKVGECLQPTPKVLAETVTTTPIADIPMPTQNLPVAYFPNDWEKLRNKQQNKPKKSISGSLKISFSLGSSRLGAGAVKNLQGSLPKLIKAETIHIRGWADSSGGKASAINKHLAQERAKKIRTWLVERKVPASKIKIQSNPACCNRDNTRQAVVSWANYREKR